MTVLQPLVALWPGLVTLRLTFYIPYDHFTAESLMEQYEVLSRLLSLRHLTLQVRGGGGWLLYYSHVTYTHTLGAHIPPHTTPHHTTPHHTTPHHTHTPKCSPSLLLIQPPPCIPLHRVHCTSAPP